MILLFSTSGDDDQYVEPTKRKFSNGSHTPRRDNRWFDFPPFKSIIAQFMNRWRASESLSDELTSSTTLI